MLIKVDFLQKLTFLKHNVSAEEIQTHPNEITHCLLLHFKVNTLENIVSFLEENHFILTYAIIIFVQYKFFFLYEPPYIRDLNISDHYMVVFRIYFTASL